MPRFPASAGVPNLGRPDPRFANVTRFESSGDSYYDGMLVTAGRVIKRVAMADEPVETGLIGGAEKREIKIVDYDTDWPKQFESHAGRIARALGDAALRIEHVGSTSVPGLAAKPIIDIIVVVPDSAKEAAYLPQLEAAGYVLRVREPDWNEHRMFRTPERDVHVHVYSLGCPEIERNLTFRDRLRQNDDDRRRYERTKRELAAREWPDMNAYAEAKTEVIESILAASPTPGGRAG